MKRFLVWLRCCCLSRAGKRAKVAGDVVPRHYQITLAPDLKSATFEGEETIEVRVLKPASNIVLNAAEIKFRRRDRSLGPATQTAKVTTDEKSEMATLALGDAVRLVRRRFRSSSPAH